MSMVFFFQKYTSHESCCMYLYADHEDKCTLLSVRDIFFLLRYTSRWKAVPNELRSMPDWQPHRHCLFFTRENNNDLNFSKREIRYFIQAQGYDVGPTTIYQDNKRRVWVRQIVDLWTRIRVTDMIPIHGQYSASQTRVRDRNGLTAFSFSVCCLLFVVLRCLNNLCCGLFPVIEATPVEIQRADTAFLQTVLFQLIYAM